MTTRLWVAFFAGHLAWSTHLLVGYFLASQACLGSEQSLLALHNMLTPLGICVTLVGATAAWLEHRQVGDSQLVTERRFMARVVLVLSGIFLYAVVLASAAGLILPACA